MTVPEGGATGLANELCAECHGAEVRFLVAELRALVFPRGVADADFMRPDGARVLALMSARFRQDCLDLLRVREFYAVW